MDKKIIYEQLKYILLNSEKPSIEIREMISDGKFKDKPFNILAELEEIEQNPKYHKEGNVLNHTLFVVDKASLLRDKSKNKSLLMVSALLHDIGKLTTTKMRKGRWTSYNHEIESSKMVVDFLEDFENKEFVDKVSNMVLYHMESLNFQNRAKLKGVKPNSFKARLQKIVTDVDIDDFILLVIADRTGRKPIDEEVEIAKIIEFKNYLLDISK